MLAYSRLASFALDGDIQLPDSGPSTAFGRRLLDLSERFHEESLPDETLLHYLEELAGACSSQLAAVVEIGSDVQCLAAHTGILEYLEGVLDLAERVDMMFHQEVIAEVKSLEESLTVAVCCLSMGTPT